MPNKKDNQFYITTPIYYVNDVPHLGHTYTTVAADALARYHRLIGNKTFFLTGTDEHGAKIAEKAKSLGIPPQQFVDQIAASFKLAWDELDISNDNFIRTTDFAHIKAVQNALQIIYDKGDIYKGKYRGLYCQGCEQYKSEKDLIKGLCPDHKIAPQILEEECYMFKLSKYQKDILAKIKSDDLKILPESRKKEVINFYENFGLEDISFSRKKVSWGIPLPWDETQTTYVWADAFLNYLTGLGWQGKSKAPDFWPPEIQLMSKDILRVHATIWPAMLMSLGLALPKLLFVHGFFLIDGQKMSKSLGNVITPAELVKKYGSDGAKYLLLSATPFGHDGDISWQKFDEKYNADLANGLGNLVARVLTMAEKKLDSLVPKINHDGFGKINIIKTYQQSINNLEIDQVLAQVFDCQKYLDGLIEQNKVYKQEGKIVEQSLYALLESIRIIAWYLTPFMPETADRIFTQLGLNPAQEKEKQFFKAIAWGGLKPGTKVKKGENLFPRLK